MGSMSQTPILRLFIIILQLTCIVVLLSLLKETSAEPTKCMLTQTSATCAYESGSFLSTYEFTHVHALYIVESDFSNTSPKDFSNFKDLYTLHISNSSDMAPNLLSSISSQLTELRITSTPLRNNGALINKDVTNLVMLTLVDVELVNISSDIFGNHSKMEVLELGENKITSIEMGAFDGLPNLLELNLSENRLQTVPSEVFSNLKQLRTLDLSKNHIYVLKKHLFRGLDNLRVLNLSNNKISAIEWRALRGGVKNMKMLDLRNNALGAGLQHGYIPSENDQGNGISCTVCRSNSSIVTTETFDDDIVCNAPCRASVPLAALWQDFANLDDSNSRLGSRVYLNDNPVCDTHMQRPLSSTPRVVDDARVQQEVKGPVKCVTSQDECLSYERFRLFLLEACKKGDRSPVKLEVTPEQNYPETSTSSLLTTHIPRVEEKRPEEQPLTNKASLGIFGVFSVLVLCSGIVVGYIVGKKRRNKCEETPKTEDEERSKSEPEHLLSNIVSCDS